MKKNKHNILKIIFSSNPNCSGWGEIYITGGSFFFASLLAPGVVFLLDVLNQRFTPEKKERLKKYLKISFLSTFLVYFISIFLAKKFYSDLFSLLFFIIFLLSAIVLPVSAFWLFLILKSPKDKSFLTFLFKSFLLFFLFSIFFLILFLMSTCFKFS